ncbi:hypothetical protein P885DRAFT_78869 [Corynascus similis CBS 632.67]
MASNDPTKIPRPRDTFSVASDNEQPPPSYEAAVTNGSNYCPTNTAITTTAATTPISSHPRHSISSSSSSSLNNNESSPLHESRLNNDHRPETHCGYRSQRPMTSSSVDDSDGKGSGWQMDPAQRAALEASPGCCFSTRGGCCFSDLGGCFFSDSSGCCFSSNGGCCFSDRELFRALYFLEHYFAVNASSSPRRRFN